MIQRFPLYIVSKGRSDTRLTSKALTKMQLPHYMVVEEQEHDAYAKVVSPLCTLLVLDPAYQREYDTCDDLGDSKSRGPGPARNYAWQHSIDEGHAWHWVMDDNIRFFARFHRNMFYEFEDGSGFHLMESFTLRYTNILMAGPQYEMFVPVRRGHEFPPFMPNTRIYSCNLIKNSMPMRWRGRYNEDTDLSLRILKAGYCTCQFNAVVQKKIATQRMTGGNMADFYESEGTEPKTLMLARMHPDCTRVVQRYGRVHHQVDYSKWQDRRFIPDPDAAEVPQYTWSLRKPRKAVRRT